MSCGVHPFLGWTLPPYTEGTMKSLRQNRLLEKPLSAVEIINLLTYLPEYAILDVIRNTFCGTRHLSH